MMEAVAIQRLKDRAEAIAKFRELDPKEQEWLFPLLQKGIQRTLELIDLISEQPMTYEEIADELDVHPTTVTQKLNALAEGGYPLDITGTTAFAPTGRPRKLARKVDIKAKLAQLIAEIEED
jgi:DeoR/GlpR family transcriptional regulator of sugar metabolism